MGNRRAPSKPLARSLLGDDLFPLTYHEWQYAIQTLKLTRQQTKIIEQILRGLKDKQIASAIALSEATVRTHLTRLFAKLGIDDRVQLVLCVLAAVRRPRAQSE